MFLSIIFDFSGIFHPFGVVVTRAIHCCEKKERLMSNYGGDGLSAVG